MGDSTDRLKRSSSSNCLTNRRSASEADMSESVVVAMAALDAVAGPADRESDRMAMMLRVKASCSRVTRWSESMRRAASRYPARRSPLSWPGSSLPRGVNMKIMAMSDAMAATTAVPASHTFIPDSLRLHRRERVFSLMISTRHRRRARGIRRLFPIGLVFSGLGICFVKSSVFTTTKIRFF